MDLGAFYDLSDIKLWHYFGDERKYKDVVVQVSSDPAFAADVTTVYNNDTDNSAGLGAGTDAEYAETSLGHNIQFDKVNARYVRLYSSGSNMNSSNHYVEVEIYGLAHPTSVSLSKTTMNLEVGGANTLTASVMPLNTTYKSVAWFSSDASIATVSPDGVVTGVKPGTAAITATAADGGLKAACEVKVTGLPKNLSAGKLFSSNVFKDLARITDGSKSTGTFAEDYPLGGGLQYVQMDLGAYYDLSKIKLWHYYGDGRKYNDVIVMVSNDPTFAAEATTAYSNDGDNSAGFGAGTDAAYAETSAGLTIKIDMVNARYVRLYSNGSDKNANNHYVEAEVYGFDGPVVHPAELTLSKGTASLEAGETSALTAKVMPLNTTDKSVAWSSSDTSIATVSPDGVVTGVKAGTATITATAADGGQKAACEVKVTGMPKNLSAGRLFSSTVFKGLVSITDGSKSTGAFADDYPSGGGLQYVEMDLGAYYDLSKIKLWHYYGDGRKYNDVIVRVSNDPTFASDATTVYSNDGDNSAGLGAGTDAAYAETSAGLTIKIDMVNARYVRLYSNGSDKNANNHYVEAEVYGFDGQVVHPAGLTLNKGTAALEVGETSALTAKIMPLNTTDKSVTWSSSDTSVATVSGTGTVTGIKAGTATITATAVDGGQKAACVVKVTAVSKNLSAGTMFTSTLFSSISSITDGNKSTGAFADDYPSGGGLQYVEMDLGAYYDLSKIKLWHYYGDGRKYNDVIVRVSNDPTFAAEATTVYSNDGDNSAGFGAGTDAAYAETSAGMTIPIDMVNARYVRLYSSGSDKNANNHYVEAEVYGFDGPVVHPAGLTLNKGTAALEVGETSALTAKVMPLNTTDKSVAWSSSNASVATVSGTGTVTGVKAGTATITATAADGGQKAACVVKVTAVSKNLSTGRLFTSPIFKDLTSITDGNKNTGAFADDYPLGGGLQYVQMDLGSYCDLSRIKLWHYYGDGRKYNDVVVRVSSDPTFAADVTTVYNNDSDNSAGFGAGTDADYSETSAGLTIPIDMVNARYVRLYSNGSDKNNSNHYVEAEVYGFANELIMGAQAATAEQMAEYSLSKNPSPKINCTMIELAQMFLEEGKIEGVRGDIAFAQACKETGYFAYGGSALPEWNNYSGLGVTGVTYNPATATETQFTTGVTVIKDSGGNSVGTKFSEPRLGVRAQIQHLKGYATPAPLKQALVDPRYSLISKGIAPKWADLNNRWAVPGAGYGQDILRIYELITLVAIS
jgi:uncharacterized protein YjdB